MYIEITKRMLNEFTKSNPSLKDYINDIDLETAITAFHGVSQFPERHAAYEIAQYAQHLCDVKSKVLKAVQRAIKNGLQVSERHETEINTEINLFKPKLFDAYKAYFHSQGRCMSTHVTGPSNFPVNSQKKRHESADNKKAQIANLVQSATKRIIRNMLPDGDGTVIRSDSNNAVELIEIKLTAKVAAHEKMKLANKIIREVLKNPTTDHDKCVEALITRCGLKPNQAVSILEPDHVGKVGFPSYSLTNSNQEIKRLKNRLEEQKALINSRENESNSIYTLLDNGIKTELSSDNKIVIIFDGKPSDETRSELKRRAFKWSRNRAAWVRKHTLNAEKDYECFILPMLKSL